MMKVLTKEEAAESLIEEIRKADLWWNDLSQDDTVMIYKRYKDLLKQLHCNHDFYITKYYDEQVEYCIHCNLKK